MPDSDAPLAGDLAQSRPFPLDGNIRAGLTRLLQAHDYARDVQADLWDFALEIDKLYAVGLTISDLRWFVAKGVAKHGQEITVFDDRHRSFCTSDGLNFLPKTCLILTPKGTALARNLIKESANSSPPSEPIASATLHGRQIAVPPSDSAVVDEEGRPLTIVKPRWDSTRRELCVAQAIVKRYRVPAPNQETILGVFEEEGWPVQIDDPLPFREDIDPRTRLHDTINRLNGCQSRPLLRFHGNGSGTGVSWELRRNGHSISKNAHGSISSSR